MGNCVVSLVGDFSLRCEDYRVDYECGAGTYLDIVFLFRLALQGRVKYFLTGFYCFLRGLGVLTIRSLRGQISGKKSSL